MTGYPWVKPLGAIATFALLSACTEVVEQAKEVKAVVATTNDKVQKVIDELGLVYVEEGAQDIITYY